MALLLLGAACSQETGSLPSDVPLRMYLREVYHTSPLNNRAEFNVAAVREVWRSTLLQSYDLFFTGNEYRGELDSCGIDTYTFQAAPISPPNYVLVEDSGWIVTQVTPSGTVPHAEGLRLFYDFWTSDSVIPAFVIPRLIELRLDGSYGWRGVQALAFPGGPLFPSIWINAREPPDQFSTLAHELGHILLTSGRSDIWYDNSTAFLYVLTHVGQSKLHRVSPPGPGPVSAVTATDANRRFLIRDGIEDSCLLAKTSPLVRLVSP
jgi:hypothetical protein